MDQEKEVERLEKYIPSFDNGTRKKVNRTATHVVNTRGIHSVVGDGRGSVSTAGIANQLSLCSKIISFLMYVRHIFV